MSDYSTHPPSDPVELRSRYLLTLLHQTSTAAYNLTASTFAQSSPHHNLPPFTTFSDALTWTDVLLSAFELISPGETRTDEVCTTLSPLPLQWEYESLYLSHMVEDLDEASYTAVAGYCLVSYAMFGFGLREFTWSWRVADWVITELQRANGVYPIDCKVTPMEEAGRGEVCPCKICGSADVPVRLEDVREGFVGDRDSGVGSEMDEMDDEMLEDLCIEDEDGESGEGWEWDNEDPFESEWRAFQEAIRS